jgi:23S rRNA pseudouridine1911/1915/1917 synthase
VTAAAQLLFCVAVHDAGRLDRFLAEQLQLSRTAAARLIAERCVAVGGHSDELVRPSFVPPRGTLISVRFPEPAPRRLTPAAGIPVTVVHEDDELLVVDKPAGLVVHPAPGHWDDTLVNALAARGMRLGGGEGERPGIVHRLDKDTSGLLVVAKTERAHRLLGAAITARTMKRRYAALAWGHLKTEGTEGTDRRTGPSRRVAAPLARHPKDRTRMAIHPEGRHAATTFTTIARGTAADLIRCELETGRTHQIRVHLASIGHAVVGDVAYGGDAARRSDATRAHAAALLKATPRHALHAAWLQLPHPATGKVLEVRSEWPADLRASLVVAIADPNLLEESKPLQYLGFFDSGRAT